MKEIIISLTCLLALAAADLKCYCRTGVDVKENWPFGDRLVEKWNQVTIGKEIDGSCNDFSYVLFENVTFSKIIDPFEHCGKQSASVGHVVQQMWIRNSGFGQLLLSPKASILRISDTSFTKLVIDDTQIYKTVRIYLKNVPLGALPKNLNTLQNLVAFVAKEIPLQELTLSQFNGLSKLQSITISNGLTSVAVGSADLPALISLNFHSNRIEKVPSDISSLRSLEMLNFCFNKISHLDMTVFNGLDLLQDLKISHNPLHVIHAPTTVNLPNLQHLHLQHTFLEQLDVSLWHMPKLNSINLNWNNLTVVENLEGQFPRETIVYADGNKWRCSWLKETSERVTFHRLHGLCVVRGQL